MNLKGNSGCNIEQQGDKVVKTAIGSYAPRLREQAQKQYCATSWSGTRNSIEGTPVLNIKEDLVGNDLKVTVTMPFIEGDTLAEELLKHKGISSAEDLGAFISSNFTFGKVWNSKVIFKNKIDDMIKKTPELRNELQEFLKEFEQDLGDIKGGYCHGDLTLENIIVGHKETYSTAARVLYLIDFLDSFIDTPYIDIATVLQDSLCHWSYRYTELDEDDKKYLRRFSQEFLERVGGNYRPTMKKILIFLLFKIYRIVPYAKDDVTKRWCSDNIKYVKSLFDCLPEPKDNGYYSQYVNLNDFWRE
jgi:predicted nucleic acid-binding protein